MLPDRALWPSIAGAVAFRSACYVIMIALAIWNELRPAPSLPDLVLEVLPYVPSVHRLNYLAWVALYVPLSLALLALEPARWCRYMVTGGLVALARGVCIALTGLGPPDPAHAGPGIAGHGFWEVFVQLLSPRALLPEGAAQLYLTKDLFFSGHTATTFLLVLYLWHRARLRWVAIGAHAIVVATVLLAHLHYAIDVVGAWAVTFAIFAAREWRPRASAG